MNNQLNPDPQPDETIGTVEYMRQLLVDGGMQTLDEPYEHDFSLDKDQHPDPQGGESNMTNAEEFAREAKLALTGREKLLLHEFYQWFLLKRGGKEK
jgi:hypothetical protein